MTPESPRDSDPRRRTEQPDDHAVGQPADQPGANTRAATDGGYATATGLPVTDGGTRTDQVSTIAETEYRLAIRSRWALALTGLFAFFGLMLATFSGSAVGPTGAQRVLASLTSLTVYLVPLAALAFGYDAIVGREEEGWLEVVFSLPVSRARVVAGTYLGGVAVLAGATVLGFGLVGGLMLREYGATHWGSFLVFLGGAILLGGVFLGIAILVSAAAREKTHALGVALLVWVWFALVHDLLALGVIAALDLPELAITAAVLLNPASAFRVLVLGHLGTSASGGFAAAYAATGLSTPILAGALLAWTVLPVAAAAIIVARRRI